MKLEKKTEIHWAANIFPLLRSIIKKRTSRCFRNKAFPLRTLHKKKRISASSICVNIRWWVFWPLLFTWKANDILMIPSSFFSHLHKSLTCSLIHNDDLICSWDDVSIPLSSTCLQALTFLFFLLQTKNVFEKSNRIFISSNQLMKYSFDISATTSITGTPLLCVTWIHWTILFDLSMTLFFLFR